MKANSVRINPGSVAHARELRAKTGLPLSRLIPAALVGWTMLTAEQKSKAIEKSANSKKL